MYCLKYIYLSQTIILPIVENYLSGISFFNFQHFRLAAGQMFIEMAIFSIAQYRISKVNSENPASQELNYRK
jgi:hypothetical protein